MIFQTFKLFQGHLFDYYINEYQLTFYSLNKKLFISSVTNNNIFITVLFSRMAIALYLEGISINKYCFLKEHNFVVEYDI